MDTTLPENLTTGPFSKFLISKSNDFPTAVEALFATEKEYPFLNVTTSIIQDVDFITAKSDSTKDLLTSLTTLSPGKVVQISPCIPVPKRYKAILERFPLGFPINRLTELPYVLSATQCYKIFERRNTPCPPHNEQATNY